MITADNFRQWIAAQCGKWHRFNPGDTKSKNSKPARYLLHDDERPVGWFMDWRNGTRHRWFGSTSFETMDRDAINGRRKERQEALTAQYDAAAAAAKSYWDNSEPAKANGSRHAYLAAKSVSPHHTRERGERLLVPLYNADGVMRSLQSIKPDGSRKFWDKTSVAGCYSPIGDFASGPIVLCEGFSTGASLYEATGYPVVVCLDAANMVAVARWAGHKWVGREFIVAGDDDWHLTDNPKVAKNVGREAAENAARLLGARVVIASLLGLESNGGDDFNDVAREYGLEAVAEQLKVSADFNGLAPADDRLVVAAPFVWRDTADIPKREWLYGKHLLRRFVSVDVAAGGVGKSSLKVGEALSMASGNDFYGKGLPEGALTVWLWNLEDPLDEIERRFHATAQNFGVTPSMVEGRLYADSGRDKPLTTAIEGPDGAQILKPVTEALIAEMLFRKVDVLVVDPFISSHTVSENDNNAIDLVAREWNVIAERANAAINLVHHVRKGNGVEATADSARGASALIGKARSVHVYNRMSSEEAATLGVDGEERRFFFRVDNDKANLAPPDATDWYRMNNVDLINGDSVGVATPWSPPDLFAGLSARHLYAVQAAIGDGQWRENVQTKEQWVGVPVASALGWDLEVEKDRKRIAKLIKAWVHEGALEVVEMEDKKRMMRKFVVVGRWVER